VTKGCGELDLATKNRGIEVHCDRIRHDPDGDLPQRRWLARDEGARLDRLAGAKTPSNTELVL
jgi:hypothetical protein